jgi:uncharacterized membrane protein YozB (DUF420 family)
MRLELFPPINATLNGLSALLLLIGYVLVKRQKYAAHATMMISAFVSSTVFLACYLTYHILLKGRLTRFPPSTVRPIYYTILGTHTILAIVILPMILITFWHALHRQWAKHRRIARWTFPLWLYVSITGVVIYWMLYHLAPRLAR